MLNKTRSLPSLHFGGHRLYFGRLTRQFGSDSLIEQINHSQCKNAQFLRSIRNRLKPSVGGPYRVSTRARRVPDPSRMSRKRSGTGQRIFTTKMLRTKELQNQLADAHYHLHELANENKLLRVLQKRQELALERYEGVNAKLPQIINSHHEELRVMNEKYKQLKSHHRYTCDLLKDKEKNILILEASNRHYQQLSSDLNLEEREILQIQVLDLNDQILQQHETIRILNRKLIIQSKRLNYYVKTEISKHKETKKKLQETLEKLKNVEQMLASKEKQSHNGRLPAFYKRKEVTNQSVRKLQNKSCTSSFIKSTSNNKNSENASTKNSLPKLPGSDPNESKKTIPKSNSSKNARSETMTSLEQIKNFRLPKSGHSRRSSINGRNSLEKAQKLDTKFDEQSTFIAKHSRSNSVHNSNNKNNNNADTQESEEDKEVKNITYRLEKKSTDAKYQMPNEIIKEASLSYSDNDTDDEESKEEKLITSTNKSRILYTKLINGYINSPNTAEENINSILKKPNEEIKNHQNISNNKRVSDFIKDNLNADNGCDDKVVDVEPEETKKDIQTNNEDDAYINLLKTNIGIENIKKDNNKISLTGLKSWTILKNQKEEKLDDLLFHFQKINLKSKPLNNNSSKIIDDNDELLQYFDKNRYANVKDEQSYGKQAEPKPSTNLGQSQKINLSTPVFDGDSKVEEKNLNKAADQLNEFKGIKEDQEMKSTKFEKKEKINNSPTQNSENSGLQETAFDKKISNFNKQKLLAALKAIDNENIEYLSKKKSSESASRSQVTENLYRGLPTHTKKRQDILKDIFGSTKLETKLQSGCSKLH